MAADNIYEDLKDVLEDFKEFLEKEPQFTNIKKAIKSLASMFPKIEDVIDELINLMNQINTEIGKLDVKDIPGLSDVTNFTEQITNFLNASADLLPSESSSTVDEIKKGLNVVSGLPSLEDVKKEIQELITFIVGKLTELKPA